MKEHRKRMAAVGDGILLACARLFLYEHRRDVPYKIHTKLIALMVCNNKLIEIAALEGMKADEDEKLSDAFEVEVAGYYFGHGFRDTKYWLWGIFKKHFNLTEEVRRILEPAPVDKLEKQIRGALKGLLRNGQITDVQKTTRVILQALQETGAFRF
jgi:hypothetical protein